MDIILVLLRLLHIVTAFIWVGLGITVTFYLIPAALKSGESGLRFFKSLLAHTNFGMIFSVVAGLTTLAGILLYAHGNALRVFSQTGNIVLGIGAIAGIAATIHGGAVLGRNTKALEKQVEEHVPDNAPVAADALTKINGMIVELKRHANISTGLMLVALICMGGARYL